MGTLCTPANVTLAVAQGRYGLQCGISHLHFHGSCPDEQARAGWCRQHSAGRAAPSSTSSSAAQLAWQRPGFSCAPAPIGHPGPATAAPARASSRDAAGSGPRTPRLCPAGSGTPSARPEAAASPHPPGRTPAIPRPAAGTRQGQPRRRDRRERARAGGSCSRRGGEDRDEPGQRGQARARGRTAAPSRAEPRTPGERSRAPPVPPRHAQPRLRCRCRPHLVSLCAELEGRLLLLLGLAVRFPVRVAVVPPQQREALPAAQQPPQPSRERHRPAGDGTGRDRDGTATGPARRPPAPCTGRRRRRHRRDRPHRRRRRPGRAGPGASPAPANRRARPGAEPARPGRRGRRLRHLPGGGARRTGEDPGVSHDRAVTGPVLPEPPPARCTGPGHRHRAQTPEGGALVPVAPGFHRPRRRAVPQHRRHGLTQTLRAAAPAPAPAAKAAQPGVVPELRGQVGTALGQICQPLRPHEPMSHRCCSPGLGPAAESPQHP